MSYQEICKKNLVSVFLILICLVFSSPKEKLFVAWKQLCLYICLELVCYQVGSPGHPVLQKYTDLTPLLFCNLQK